MLLPHALSRVPSKVSTAEIHLDMHVSYIAFSYVRLQQLNHQYHNSWVAHHYSDMLEELKSDDGQLLKSNRLIISMVLQKKYLQDLHEDYVSIIKSQTEAFNTIHWPSTDDNIDGYICHCGVFIKSKQSEAAKPLMKVPQGPQQNIGEDFFVMEPVISNNFPKFPFILPVNFLSLKMIATQLNQILSIKVVPREVFINSICLQQ